ncbi:MAG: hypothetical protein ACKPKO_64225, partial [Candidatus Fonsibacter sp.]
FDIMIFRLFLYHRHVSRTELIVIPPCSRHNSINSVLRYSRVFDTSSTFFLSWYSSCIYTIVLMIA